MRKDLTTRQRNLLVQFLLEGSHHGKPRKGKMIQAATDFGISVRTVTRLWTAAKKQRERGEVIHSQSRKVLYPRTYQRVHLNLELISSLELHKRGSIRTLAVAINCSKSTVGRWIKQGLIKAHTSAIKPDLTASNKLLRLRFSLEALELDRILNTLRFQNMHNTVHIDEKWFQITKGTQRYYMVPGEEEPHRTCKNKKYITKAMFECAVARPLFAPDGSVLFDGKIGIFPFTKKVPAQRTSINRVAGTMETKVIEAITREVMREWLIDLMLPAIKGKWPPFASKIIYIQQDNAKPHLTNDDPIFREAACKDGFTFILVQQPANSPDTNVNDLGFFRAIQALQHQNVCKNVDDLIDAVYKSFDLLSAETLNKVFLSLQGCMVEIMKVRGENRYKVPHMKKDAAIRADNLPLNLEVPEVLVRECLNYLIASGCSEGVNGLMQKLGIDSLEGQ